MRYWTVFFATVQLEATVCKSSKGVAEEVFVPTEGSKMTVALVDQRPVMMRMVG